MTNLTYAALAAGTASKYAAAQKSSKAMTAVQQLEAERQERLTKEAEKLLEDAKLLEACGCFALVLEKIPAALAKRVAEALTIPVIGIGAGPDVDGQVLVMHDMLGITQEFKPRFLRAYADLNQIMTQAFQQYISDVKSKDFPNSSESY